MCQVGFEIIASVEVIGIRALALKSFENAQISWIWIGHIKANDYLLNQRQDLIFLKMTNLASLQKKILGFRNERDWAQFHDPKNLAEALSIEAGELLENFRWKTTEQSRNLSPEELKNVREELADIFIFLTYICKEYNIINIINEVEYKLLLNAKKYPLQKARGSNKKYTKL